MRTVVSRLRSSFMFGRRSGSTKIWRGLGELAVVVVGLSGLTFALTYPLALHPGTLAYEPSNGDGQFSVWVVAWVARALVTDPFHVFDANIFYPHRRTLLYSEANLGAGALAMPAYWMTGNPYAAHNIVLLMSFVLAATGMYYLVRHLVGDRLAAVVSAIAFAFSSYALAHLLHIHLLLTAGLPFSLLAFHRLADRPGPQRAATLGLVMAAQGYASGYYAVFVALAVGYAAIVTAGTRRLWIDGRYWGAIVIAALTAIVAMLPQLVPFVALQREIGFNRSLDASRQFSASWRAYVASGKLLHAWMQGLVGRGQDVLFPGFTAAVFGCLGVLIGGRTSGRNREVAAIYGGLGVLALWASFGPRGGLYRVLYSTVPTFTLMRAPSRFGLVVVFALSVLSALAVAALLTTRSRRLLVGSALLAFVTAESVATLRLSPVPPTEPAYRQLATLPNGAVLELPVYSRQLGFVRAKYMVASTAHWKPLVDAYSDYIPPDFRERADVLGQFPTRDGLKDAAKIPFRYAVFHLDKYQADAREALFLRLTEFAPYLRRLYGDEGTLLYEVTGCPP